MRTKPTTRPKAEPIRDQAARAIFHWFRRHPIDRHAEDTVRAALQDAFPIVRLPKPGERDTQLIQWRWVLHDAEKLAWDAGWQLIPAPTSDSTARLLVPRTSAVRHVITALLDEAEHALRDGEALSESTRACLHALTPDPHEQALHQLRECFTAAQTIIDRLRADIKSEESK